MKIGVVGCGALGSYYGGMLSRSGHQVHFLLRSNAALIRERGVSILSPAGDFRFHPECAEQPEDIGVCDGVLIGLKTTANEAFARLLPALVGPQTAVLTLQNGLGNEEALERLFPAEQILGGLCFVCLNRLEAGVVHHLAHGRISLGEFRRPPLPRTHEFAAAFRQAGVPCEVSENLERAHWEKLVWNIPFNGLGVASAAGLEALRAGQIQPGCALQPCLTTDQLLADPDWLEWVQALMREVIAAANGLGLGVSLDLEERHLASTRSMGPYRASTLVDFERGQPLELAALFLEPLRRARAAGVPVPRLEALCAVLRALDRDQGGSGNA
ncbi:MAG: 2-dehydropantoate 2-reductase [Verrucomicrobiales bacterium]|nr:2-dehydropantoate 2-reductase [Verrucomicrobiales bacterium]